LIATSIGLQPLDIDTALRWEAFGALAGLETAQASLAPGRRDYCELQRFAAGAVEHIKQIRQRGWVVLMTPESRDRNHGAGRHDLSSADQAVLAADLAEAISKMTVYRSACLKGANHQLRLSR
jgi:hypothetical protein